MFVNDRVWDFMELALFMLGLVFTLWLYSSKFDETEVKSITQCFFYFLGVSYGVRKLKDIKRK